MCIFLVLKKGEEEEKKKAYVRNIKHNNYCGNGKNCPEAVLSQFFLVAKIACFCSELCFH